MGKFNMKEAEGLKEKVIEASNKGICYFLKNTLLVLLILVGCYIFTNPNIIMNPSEFVKNFDRSSIYSVVILSIIVISIFRLGKSILYDDGVTQDAADKEKFIRARKEHAEEINKRILRNPDISMVLKDLLINLNGSRATVCEMHNGTNTLAGVPFVHVSMTYEEISHEVHYSAEDYNAINMSRMPFISKHFEDGSWIGETDEIMKEDKYLATKLKCNGDEYIGFAIMHGKNSILGVLTIAFPDKDNHPTKTEISRELMTASQKLSILLDK